MNTIPENTTDVQGGVHKRTEEKIVQGAESISGDYKELLKRPLLVQDPKIRHLVINFVA
jgi:hypothetical protein